MLASKTWNPKIRNLQKRTVLRKNSHNCGESFVKIMSTFWVPIQRRPLILKVTPKKVNTFDNPKAKP